MSTKDDSSTAAGAREKATVGAREERNVADLWVEALKPYKDTIGFEATPGNPSLRGARGFFDRESEGFAKFRHDGKTLDKLRSLLSRCFDLFEQAVEPLAEAATSSFPPADVVGKAITWVLHAFMQVSAAYDEIERFFTEVNAFFDRIVILEKSMPQASAFQNHLIAVFTSYLNLCVIARKFIKQRRLKKFFLGFIGEDNELDSAREEMRTKLQALHDATILVIAANTEEINKMEAALRQNQEAHTRMLENQTSMQWMTFDAVKSIERLLLDRLSEPQDRFSKAKVKAKAADKSGGASSSLVRSALPDVKGEISEYHILKETIVTGTCTWLFSQPEWKQWVGEDGNEEPNDASAAPPMLLAIMGQSGSGKSHIAITAYDHLQGIARDNPYTCVAHFHFREQNPNLDSFVNAIITTINQVAEQNALLCDRVCSLLLRDDLELDTSDPQSIHKALLQRCFEENSRHRLFIVLDGIDELSSEQRNEIGQFWRSVVDANLRISLVLTSRIISLDTLVGEQTEAALIIHVTPELQKADLAALVRDGLNNLPSLKRFNSCVQERISEKIQAVAPSLLYAQHMLRRFDEIGRQGAVLGQLDKPLPATVEDLYITMLTECLRRTAESRHEAVSVLFRWLAFSFEPLVLGVVVSLLRHVSDKEEFDLDDIPEPMTRFVRIGDPGHDSEALQTSEVDYLDTGDVGDPVYQDGQLPVKFRERAMRSFFCEAVTASASEASRRLLASPSEAHRRIFLESSRMSRLASEQSATLLDPGLTRYATLYLMSHWLRIELKELSPAHRVEIMETLASVLSNEYGYATMARRVDVDYKLVFDDDILERMRAWAAELSGEDGEHLSGLSSSAILWWKRVAQHPANSLIELAKAHVRDVYGAKDSREALSSYECALSALLRSGYGDKLSKQAATNFAITLQVNQQADVDYRGILGFAGLFDDIPMTSTAYRAIASILIEIGQDVPARSTCATALAYNPDPLERFELTCMKARAEFHLNLTAEAKGTIAECLTWPNIEGIPETSQRWAQVINALIEAESGNRPAAAAAFSKARSLDKGKLIGTDILDKEVNIYRDAEDYAGLIDVIRRWTPIERFAWLTLDYYDTARHLGFHEAAARAGQQEYLVEVYQAVIAQLDKFSAAAPLQCDLASAHLLVLGHAEDARRVLDEVLDGYSKGDLYKFTYEIPSTVLERAINLQSRVLRDLFVPSHDPVVKAALLEAARGLVERPLAKCVSASSATDRLYHKITLARMTLQMGPRVDFQAHLQHVISVCFDTLEDNVGWNDSRSVRLLSQALAHLNKAVRWPRIERAARILMSAYFSKLEPVADTDSEGDSEEQKIVEDEEHAGDGEGGTSECPADVITDASKPPTANGESDKETRTSEGDGEGEGDEEGKTAEDQEDAVAGSHAEPPADEGDLCDWYFSCRGTICKPTVYWKRWNGRSLFMCIDCDCAGFCDACYAALQADNDGKAPFEGRRFCGRGHEHIKAPIEGWRGIKDGVMRIEGEEDVPFKEFLRSVREELCKEAWDKFWEG